MTEEIEVTVVEPRVESTLPSRREAEQAEIVVTRTELTQGKPCAHCGDTWSTMRCLTCRRVLCKPTLHDCALVHRCRDAQ